MGPLKFYHSIFESWWRWSLSRVLVGFVSKLYSKILYNGLVRPNRYIWKFENILEF